MNLFPDEQILLKSPSGSLVLTSHRIRYDVQATGSGELISIMLEELASCATVSSSNSVFLIIAAISLISGAFAAFGVHNDGSILFVVGLVIALLFVGLYFGTRQQVLAFGSAGATICINAGGIKKEVIMEFIEQAEAAKNRRYKGTGLVG